MDKPDRTYKLTGIHCHLTAFQLPFSLRAHRGPNMHVPLPSDYLPLTSYDGGPVYIDQMMINNYVLGQLLDFAYRLKSLIFVMKWQL